MLSMRFQELLMWKNPHVNFCTECRKSLWNFPCDIFTDPSVHLLFHGIQNYPQMISNVNIFMTGWNKICSTSEAWNMQQWFGLIFLCIFQLQTMFSIHFFVFKVYLMLYKEHSYHNIEVKIWTHTLPNSFSFG